MRSTDQPDPALTTPLGSPIRQEAPKPTPAPVPTSTPGVINRGGKLETAIPPPSAPAPVVRAMHGRDANISTSILVGGASFQQAGDGHAMRNQQAADWLKLRDIDQQLRKPDRD